MAIEIQSIEQFTEDIRQGMLTLLFADPDGELDTGGSKTYGYAGVAHAFDRALTKALLWQIRQGETRQPSINDLAANLASVDGSLHGKLGKSKGKGGPKPGSKAAKERAQKAQETRRRNAALRKAVGQATEDVDKLDARVAASKPATGFGGLPQSGPGGV